MSFRHGAFVKATSTTTGTGTITLIADGSGAFKSFAGAFGAGPVPVFYAIKGASYFEFGVGVFDNSGPTLTRVPIDSSNSGAAVSLPAATHDAYVAALAQWPADVRTGSPSLVLADLFGAILYEGTGGTVGLPALSGLPAGIALPVLHRGTGVLALDPNSSEQINGATVEQLLPGEGGFAFNRDAATQAWAAILARTRLKAGARTTTSEALTSADHSKHNTFANAGAIACSLADADTLPDGYFTIVEVTGAGEWTGTPSGCTINSAATLVLQKGQWAIITGDNANYRALVGGASPGKQSLWIPASAMRGRSTNGPADGQAESTTNKIMQITKDFDPTTNEFAQFTYAMPKSWDLGPVTFKPYWLGAAAGNVIFGLQGVAISDNEAIDAAFGTAQEVTDARIASNLCVGSESAGITIAGTPAAEDLVVFQVYRNAASASDTMTGADAKLLGIKLFLNTVAPNDR